MPKPRIYKTPEELDEKMSEYFLKTKTEEITISGLCLHLMINKDTFYEYAKRIEYKEIINFARLRVENAYEKSLRKYGRTGDIFALKNFGWSDKQEIDANVTTTEIRVDLDD